METETKTGGYGMFAKRALVLMMALMLAAFVLGCGGGSSTDAPATDPEPETEPPPPMEEPTEEPPVESETMGDPVLNDVFFAFDKHNLTAEAKGTLEANAGELRDHSDVAIVIEGHCDERGTKSYNLALGEKRANAARDYLIALGISGSRITVISYGKERPFDPGHTEAAWAKNRRAHFKLK
jgi:peptidoglycan-associated lipoprotein